MKSDYWWYKTYLLQLKQYKPKLAEGMDHLWDNQDKPLKERNERLIELLNIIQNKS